MTSPCHQRLLGIVQSPRFDWSVGILVIINAMSIGLQTDYMAKHSGDHVPRVYRVVDVFFCVIFVAEIVLRIFVHRLAFFYRAGCSWNIFDSFVVVMQCMEELLRLMAYSLNKAGLPTSFTFMRTLRLLRLVRIMRVIRILHLIGELRTIVLSISSSLKSLLWTVVLLFSMMYVAGVYFTQLVVDHEVQVAEAIVDERLQIYYGSLGRSILTLYQSITSGFDWIDMVNPLIEHISPMMGLIFSLFVAFSVLAMMNVITGVFVDAALKNAKDYHDNFLLDRVRLLFMNADKDHNGMVGWDEFEDQLENPYMHEFFKAIDVDLSDAESVFRLLDVDDSGVLDFDQFMDGCLRLRGPAKAIDLSLLMHESRRTNRRFLARVGILEYLLKQLVDLLPDHVGGLLEADGPTAGTKADHS